MNSGDDSVRPDRQFTQQKPGGGVDQPGFGEVGARYEPVYNGGTRINLGPDEQLSTVSGNFLDPQQQQEETLGNLPTGNAIDARAGSYILSFGFPGAGKSTFQSHLVRWIAKGGRFDWEIAENDSNGASRIAFNNWIRAWGKGEFPRPTAKGVDKVVEMRVSATPKEGKKKKLVFNFLEISGEDLKEVMPSPRRPSWMMEPLREYLGNPKINFILVLIVDPTQLPAENEVLFTTLLDYLNANFPTLKDRMSLLMILSMPELALDKMKKEGDARSRDALHDFPGLQYVEQMQTEHCDYYFEKYVPMTYARVTGWGGRWATAKLRIGTPVDTVDGTLVDKVDVKAREYRDVEFYDVEKIFSWIFTTFSGQKLGPGRLKNVWDALGQNG